MKRVKLGQFMPGHSIVHNLDPRTKILCCFILTFSTLFFSKFIIIFWDLGIVILALGLAQVNFKVLIRGFRKIFALVAVSFLFQALLTPGIILVQFGPIKVTEEGLVRGALTSLRLIILYYSSVILTMTTSPIKLASGLEALFAPLKVFGFPIHQLATVISTSLRFMPTIMEEAEIITRAQMARGAPFKSANILKRINSFVAVLIPLLASSLRRAEDLAVAMEARCYTGEQNTCRLGNLYFGKIDSAVLAVVFVTGLFAVLI